MEILSIHAEDGRQPQARCCHDQYESYVALGVKCLMRTCQVGE